MPVEHAQLWVCVPADSRILLDIRYSTKFIIVVGFHAFFLSTYHLQYNISFRKRVGVDGDAADPRVVHGAMVSWIHVQLFQII